MAVTMAVPSLVYLNVNFLVLLMNAPTTTQMQNECSIQEQGGPTQKSRLSSGPFRMAWPE